MLLGMITDGDLRRNLSESLPNRLAEDIMTEGPTTVKPEALAADVLRIMTSGTRKLTQIFVCDDVGKPVGFIHMHDLLKIGVS